MHVSSDIVGGCVLYVALYCTSSTWFGHTRSHTWIGATDATDCAVSRADAIVRVQIKQKKRTAKVGRLRVLEACGWRAADAQVSLLSAEPDSDPVLLETLLESEQTAVRSEAVRVKQVLEDKACGTLMQDKQVGSSSCKRAGIINVPF